MCLLYESMAFADRLEEIMTARGIDQTALAATLGLTSQAVSQWCNGTTKPRGQRLEKIAVALGVTPPDLLAPRGTPLDMVPDTRRVFLSGREADLIEALRGMRQAKAEAIFQLADVRSEPEARPHRPFPVNGGAEENQADMGCGDRVVPIQQNQKVSAQRRGE